MKKIVAGIFGLLWSFSSFAQQSSSSITITTLVEASCEIVSTQNLLFGIYDPVGVNATLPARASGNIQVRCTNGTNNVKVALSEGQNASSGSSCLNPRRQMKSNSGAFLPYTIYQESDEVIVWGCSASTSRSLPAFETLSPRNVPTFGLIASGHDVPLGTYQDIVEVTVSF